MKNFILFFLFLAFTSILFSQNTKSLYSKSYKHKNTEVNISEIEKNISVDMVVKNYLIEINVNNTIIKKEELIGPSYAPGISSSGIRDFDNDGNLEIYLTYSTEGSGAYSILGFYELNEYELISYELPELNSNVSSLHRGHNKIKVTKNGISNDFPAYNKDDANCCPTAGSVTVNYSFINSNIIETGYSHEPIDTESINNKNSISFTIKQILDLPKMDRMSASDTWLKISQGDKLIGKTKVIKNNNSPKIDVTFTLDKNINIPITIEVYDKDMTKSELIGITTLQKTITGTYPILKEQSNGNIKKQGEVEIEFKDN